MLTRKINWIPSWNGHESEIKMLEEKLFEFYSTNSDYYEKIDFTSDNWINPDEIGYQEIIKIAAFRDSICEIGCGNANLLVHYPYLASKYSGCDFSDLIMRKNRIAFPEATFSKIEEPNTLPFPDSSFDFVFSVFVLEHSTNPSKLLDECARILIPGGMLAILCPDFMGQKKMTSQRAGWSHGTARQKLKKGKILDAIVTLYDNRIRIPFYCKKFIKKSRQHPLFMVNLSPTVFEHPFIPDVDAVYVTNRDEIITHLADRFELKENDKQLTKYAKEKALIFLRLDKIG